MRSFICVTLRKYSIPGSKNHTNLISNLIKIKLHNILVLLSRLTLVGRAVVAKILDGASMPRLIGPPRG